MSTLYATGVHRLVYKAGAFAAGKTVTGYLWSPTLVKSDLQTFTEVEDGLYYLDYTFSALGTYFGIFHENDVAMTAGTFRVVTGPGVLTAAERNSIADAVLTRDVDNVEATANEHTLCTIILATLESAISETTWTIKRTDGITTHAAKTVTVDAAADPITGVT